MRALSRALPSTPMSAAGHAAARLATVLAALVVLAACTGGESEPERDSSARSRSGALRVAGRAGDVHAPYVVRDRLYGMSPRDEPERLAGVVNAPFFATLAPAAVAGDGGQSLAYHSFRNRSPVIAVHDTSTGEERVVARGAFSVAWADDGRMAYFRGVSARVRDPQRYRGHVVVRRSPGAPERRWTAEAGRYVVAAWSGNRLVVHRMRDGWPDVLVFDGPGSARVLARRAALVALSPDGKRAFLTREPAPSPAVSIVDVGGGGELATLDLRDADAGVERISYVADSGSWVGDEIVAAVTDGLAVFRVRGNALVVDQVLRVDPEVFPTGLVQPRADASGRRVAAVAEVAARPRGAVGTNVLLECDRVTLRCARGPETTVPEAPHVVYNPSR